MVLFWICVALLVITVALSAGLYLFIFFNHPDKHKTPEMQREGDQYKPYRELYMSYIEEIAELPCKRIYIKSFDGLKLSAGIMKERLERLLRSSCTATERLLPVILQEYSRL